MVFLSWEILGFGMESVSYGGIKMKNVQKMIRYMDFAGAYQKLSELNYCFDFKNLAQDFRKIDSLKMYMFLMYAISQAEDVEKHLSICDYLYFMEPYVTGADTLIKWHLLRVLEISPCRHEVFENWIFGIYNGNPDNPFTEEDLIRYSQMWKNENGTTCEKKENKRAVCVNPNEKQ